MLQTGDIENLLLTIYNNGNVINWSIRTMRVKGKHHLFGPMANVVPLSNAAENNYGWLDQSGHNRQT